jgi:hypothetical protein
MSVDTSSLGFIGAASKSEKLGVLRYPIVAALPRSHDEGTKLRAKFRRVDEPAKTDP